MTKEQEIAYIDQTLKLLRRGKFELTGEEALVLGGVFKYLVERLNQLKTPLVPKEVVEPVKTEPTKKGKK